MFSNTPWGVLFACVSVFLLGVAANAILDINPGKVSVTPSAHAVATVPTKMNFQGRLTDATGVIVANGTYNMQFRFYSASSGGSLLWSEERLVNDTKGVTVTNGLFAIKLGEGDVIGAGTGATALNPANFASGSVYLEVTMATPANATTNTASTSMVWESPMSPRSQMATSAYAFNSETLDGLDSADFAQITANNTFTGTNLMQTASNSASAFEVQSSTSASILKVDTTGTGGVTLLGNSSAALGSWITATNSIPNFWPSSTATASNGYVYVSGGFSGTAKNTVYYAQLQADGSLGTWQTATNTLPQTLYNANSVVVNGYLYVLGGRDSGGAFTGLTYYSKLSANGSPGTWSSTATLGHTAQAGVTTKNGYIYILGGDDNPSGIQNFVAAAKSNADGSLTTATSAAVLAYNFISGAAVGNYVYAIGGNDGSNHTDVYYALVNADGSTSWTSTTSLPGSTSGSIVGVINGTIYARSGTSVYYARPVANGTISSWSTLTGAPSTTSTATVAANGYLYSIAASSQYAKAGGVVSIGGGLDLVSSLSQPGNSSGGFIKAGDISATGSLDVAGTATFATAATVTGDFNAGSGLFSTATADSLVRIGPTAADATGVVFVLDTKNTSADPTGAAATNGAMYYNSALARFRCYEGSAWTNCTPSTRVAVSTATQAPAAGTDTIVNGSTVPLGTAGLIGPTGSNQNGTLITWRIKMSKSAAGTGATTFTIRFGTAGTTSDTARCTAFSTGTATAVVDVADVVITAYATAGGSTATLNCAGTMSHMLPNTGFNNATYFVQAYSTQTSFDSTPAGTKASLSITAGTGSTITIQKVETQVVNL